MIRPALAVDAAALCDIWNPAILTSTATFTTLPKTQQDLRDMIVERPCLVAQSAQGVVLGFATYGPFRSGPGYVGVAEHSVYVAPGFPR